MARQLQITPCTAALVSLLAAKLRRYDPDTVVREAGKTDFNDAGELVLSKIAVRVRFGQAEYGKARDITATTLQTSLAYQIICRHESLRSGAEMRERTLSLIEACQEELAGARLLMPDKTMAGPVELQAVLPVNDRYGPVEDCFGLSILVPGMSQFDGRNRNPSPGGAE